MDRLIHTALSGMRASMDSQRVIASNMANANTLGFRAEMLDQRAVTIEGQPNEARAMQRASVRGADMAAGETIATGRDLDVAVETDALIASDPDNPYFLELRGQVLLESGRPDEALPALRRATELTQNEPLIASLFGHALIATENPDNFAEAEDVLRAAVAKDRLNPFAWYQLGVVYAAQGDMPRAHLASAEQQVMTRRYIEALRSAQLAESALPVGSADWLRAQDVRMEAQAALERERDKS